MSVIYRETVPDERRMDVVNRLFGLAFPLRLEAAVFSIAGRLSEQYRGGYWQFYTLCNSGFYMAPKTDAVFAVRCDNGYEGALSADAFGLTVCLYAYSHLSFDDRDGTFAEICAAQYHLLRPFALDHAEAGNILAAIA